MALRKQLTAEGMKPAQSKDEALRCIKSHASEPHEPPRHRSAAVTTEKTPAEQSLLNFSRWVLNNNAAHCVVENQGNPNAREEDFPRQTSPGLPQPVGYQPPRAGVQRQTKWE